MSARSTWIRRCSLTELDFSHVHADHGLDVVFERFGETPGLLPVVDRADTRRVEGVITLAEIRRFTKKRDRDGAA